MRGQRGGIEGGDAAPAKGDAALAQEGVGLVPQAREAEAAAVRRGQVDVEVPGSLARRREPVATAYLVLLVAGQAEPQAADDHVLLEGAVAAGALCGAVGPDAPVDRQRAPPRGARAGRA